MDIGGEAGGGESPSSSSDAAGSDGGSSDGGGGSGSDSDEEQQPAPPAGGLQKQGSWAAKHPLPAPVAVGKQQQQAPAAPPARKRHALFPKTKASERCGKCENCLNPQVGRRAGHRPRSLCGLRCDTQGQTRPCSLCFPSALACQVF